MDNLFVQQMQSKARDAVIACNLLKFGVPSYLILESMAELTKKEIDLLSDSLGDDAPAPTKGATITNPVDFFKESARRKIVLSTLTSIFYNLQANDKNLSFAEAFYLSWKELIGALSPLGPARFDITARQAWTFLLNIPSGRIKLKKCINCGCMHPLIKGDGPKCILCEQMELTHCQICQTELERNQSLIDKKWKEGNLRAVCPKCRKREESKRKLFDFA